MEAANERIRNSPSRIWRMRFPVTAVGEHPATSLIYGCPGATSSWSRISQGAHRAMRAMPFLSTPDEQTTTLRLRTRATVPTRTVFSLSNVQSWETVSGAWLQLRRSGNSTDAAKAWQSPAADCANRLLAGRGGLTSPAPGPSLPTTVRTDVRDDQGYRSRPPGQTDVTDNTVDSSVNAKVGYDLVSAPAGRPRRGLYRQLCTY